nr:MAG TPA: hypothetical protein [Caudoviricetes sp.]
MPSTGCSRTREEKPALLCENQVQGEYTMKNPYLQEATEIIRGRQGKRGPVWMCGELPTVETEEPEHEES